MKITKNKTESYKAAMDQESHLISRVEKFLEYAKQMEGSLNTLELSQMLSKARNRLRYYQHMDKSFSKPTEPLRNWDGDFKD